MGFALIAEFFHLQAFLQGLLVFVRMVIDGLAFRAFQLDHVVLGHRNLILYLVNISSEYIKSDKKSNFIRKLGYFWQFSQK